MNGQEIRFGLAILILDPGLCFASSREIKNAVYLWNLKTLWTCAIKNADYPFDEWNLKTLLTCAIKNADYPFDEWNLKPL